MISKPEQQAPLSPDAARILEQLGHAVTEAPRFIGELDRFLPLMARMVARVTLLPIMERSLEPTTRWLRAQGRGVTLSDVRAIADSLTRDVDAAFGDADLMITPTTAQPPPRVGAFADLDGEQTFRTAAALGGPRLSPVCRKARASRQPGTAVNPP